jgi:integrase
MSIILTDRHCQKQVAKRTKIYDRKCPGLFVSITAAGVATFYFKKGQTAWLGVFNPETFKVEDARSRVYRLKGNGGDALPETLRQHKAQKAKAGKTVSEIIAERIEWMKEPVHKEDGETRPRIESWGTVASHLQRLIKPRLGNKLARDVSKHDIAGLSNDIVSGAFGKASVSNARHMRRAASGLFNWAAEAGRDYVDTSPCVNLPKPQKEHSRTRVLSADEIRTFWHGLDRSDLPALSAWDRRTRLALKFELVTMLRSAELLSAHRSELFDLDLPTARFVVPSKRVKKRRVIEQPLSSLAVEIIREALGDDEQRQFVSNDKQQPVPERQFVFASPLGDQPMNRMIMATALRGTTHKGKAKRPGICELLGMQPFTPHDLRRTAATMAGQLGCSDAGIAKCLDHAASKNQTEVVPTVTTRVYQLSKRTAEKLAVLKAVAAEIRAIVGEPERKLRLVA